MRIKSTHPNFWVVIERINLWVYNLLCIEGTQVFKFCFLFDVDNLELCIIDFVNFWFWRLGLILQWVLLSPRKILSTVGHKIRWVLAVSQVQGPAFFRFLAFGLHITLEHAHLSIFYELPRSCSPPLCVPSCIHLISILFRRRPLSREMRRDEMRGKYTLHRRHRNVWYFLRRPVPAVRRYIPPIYPREWCWKRNGVCEAWKLLPSGPRRRHHKYWYIDSPRSMLPSRNHFDFLPFWRLVFLRFVLCTARRSSIGDWMRRCYFTSSYKRTKSTKAFCVIKNKCVRRNICTYIIQRSGEMEVCWEISKIEVDF